MLKLLLLPYFTVLALRTLISSVKGKLDLLGWLEFFNLICTRVNQAKKVLHILCGSEQLKQEQAKAELHDSVVVYKAIH